MKQKTLFLTTYALARCLKEFAMRLGIDESFADGIAQLHLQQSSIATNWSDFIAGNCSMCRHTPNTCRWLNPRQEDCMEGTTPRGVQIGNALVIETGEMGACPFFDVVE